MGGLRGVFGAGLALILMNFINSVWSFYFAWGVLLGISNNIVSGVPVDTTITNWFVKKRGLALSYKYVLIGFGGVFGLPLITWLITTQGWRMTCLFGGITVLIVGLPLAWFCLRQHRPEYYGLLPDGAAVKDAVGATQMIDSGVKYATEVHEVEYTLRQAVKTPAFLILVATAAFQGVAFPAISVHSLPFLTDIGLSPLTAAGIMAIMAAVSIPARVIFGYCADRLKKGNIRYLLVGSYVLQALGFAAYLLHPTQPMIYVWFILYGIGMGAGIIPLFAIRARYFGRKAFGSIQGLSMMLIVPFSVLAPIFTAGYTTPRAVICPPLS